MRCLNIKNIIAAGVLSSCTSSTAWGAIIPGHTRIIVNGSGKGEALKLTNQSRNLPYLVQIWIENTKDDRSHNFIVAIPPMVCLNPSEQIQIRMITQGKIAQSPKGGGALFCFNMRETPPKTGKKNVMQVTMQYALRLFWRSKAIKLEDDGAVTYEKVKIIRRDNGSIRSNSRMPYHVTLGYIGTNGVTMLPQTQSLMVTPFSYANTQFKDVPSTFQVGYINDFDGLGFYETNCPVIDNICSISVADRDQ